MGSERSHRRSRPRRDDRRGHAGRDPVRPEGDRGVPREGGRERRRIRVCSSPRRTSPSPMGTSRRSRASRSRCERGEIVTLIGANGAGKTTTLGRSPASSSAQVARSLRGQRIDGEPRARDRRARGSATRPKAATSSRGSPCARTSSWARSRAEDQDGRRPTSSACTSCSRSSSSARSRRPGRSPAASSRCSRSAGR